MNQSGFIFLVKVVVSLHYRLCFGCGNLRYLAAFRQYMLPPASVHWRTEQQVSDCTTSSDSMCPPWTRPVLVRWRVAVPLIHKFTYCVVVKANRSFIKLCGVPSGRVRPWLQENFKKTVYWGEEDYTTVYKNITCPSYYSKDKNIVLKTKQTGTCVEVFVSKLWIVGVGYTQLTLSSVVPTYRFAAAAFGGRGWRSVGMFIQTVKIIAVYTVK